MTITSSPAAPLVVVVGSTGNQGGSVIQALAESDKPYRIRGLTRNVGQPSAQTLASQGVEMVNVSLTVENVDAVKAAFKGGDIVFVRFRHLVLLSSNSAQSQHMYSSSPIFGNIASRTG